MWYSQLHNISDIESCFCVKCDSSDFSKWKNIGNIYEPCKSERTCLKCNHKQIIIKHQWDNNSIFCNNCGDIQSDGSELAEKIKRLGYELDESAFEFMSSLENKLVYIDSNIFMGKEISDDSYDVTEELFEYLYYHKVNIILFKEQYSEIYKLKQNKENKNSSFLARRAFKRIEKLLNLDNLIIDDLEIEGLSKSYADPIFIKKIILDIKDNKKVVFMTEDADLRIRLKSQIKQQKLNKNNLEIYSLEDIKFLNIYIDKDKLLDVYDENTIECPKCKAMIKPEIVYNPGKEVIAEVDREGGNFFEEETIIYGKVWKDSYMSGNCPFCGYEIWTK